MNRAGTARGVARVWEWSGAGGDQRQIRDRSVTVTAWQGLELMGQGGGRLADTSACRRGLGALTSGSSCSTTCRCQNPRSVGDTGVTKTDSPSLTHACSMLIQAPAQVEPWPSTHPLHEALRNAPCTAAALQVLQELAMGKGKSKGLSGSPASPRGGL